MSEVAHRPVDTGPLNRPDTPPALAAVPAAVAEIRLLGSFQIRRGDGSVVDPGEWRTGKAADLVRLLALAAGEPVSARALVTTLWPGSDLPRGQASLRTAASQVRRILGAHHLERSLAGLRLRDAWVDVAEFRSLAAKAHQLAAAGQMAGAHQTARAADLLYRGELRAHDDGSDWAQEARQSLSGAYQTLLCDAAESAMTIGLAPDAVDFAGRALQLDQFSERASRLLMRGHAGTGELSLALREYERCRTLLAEELGIDPSPQTRELHLFLLRAEPAGVGVKAPPRTVADITFDGLHQGVDPMVQVESRLHLALDVCLPQRQFARARRYADEVAALTKLPALRARAIMLACLPDVLFGRAAAARPSLARAAELAVAADDLLLRGRLDVLDCLAAHDIDAADFESKWTDAARRCEAEQDVNWAWMMIRIATERGDLDSAQLAARLPLAAAAGPLARQLHTLSMATMHAELGQWRQAVRMLEALTAADQQLSLLVAPEALARLVMLHADSDLPAAQCRLQRLEKLLDGQPVHPREKYLALLATAAIQSARGRVSTAAATAANAADLAESNGLIFLTARAHALCARYAERAHAGSARAGGASLRLSLSLASP